MKWKTVTPRLVAYVAAGAIVVVVISYSALVCVSLFLERVVSPAMEPPEHHIIIDKVKPEMPGLELREAEWRRLPSVVALSITNYTGQDVYVIDPQTNEMAKLAAGGGVAAYYKDKEGNWVLAREVTDTSRDSTAIEFHTYPFMAYGAPETSWVLEGKIDDTPFKIYGRTVCVKNCGKE